MAKSNIENKLQKLSGSLCTLHYKLGIYSREAETLNLISYAVKYASEGATRKFNNAIKKLNEHIETFSN